MCSKNSVVVSESGEKIMGFDFSWNSTARSALSIDSPPHSIKLINEMPLCLGVTYQMGTSSGTMGITAVRSAQITCAVTTGTKYYPIEHFSFETTWFLMLQVEGSFRDTQGESSLLFHSQSASYFPCQLVQSRPDGKKENKKEKKN